MSEFNSKKFYGYSTQNDPDLAGTTWNTKNFEFSCVRPETVQRAIEKVGSAEAGASLKQKKSSLLNKLREKCGDAENENRSFPDRDPDVETNMSQVQDMNAHGSDESNRSGLDSCDDEGRSPTKFKEKHEEHIMQTEEQIQNERARGGEAIMENVYMEKYDSPQPKWVEVSEPQIASLQMFDLIQAQPPMLPAFSFPPVMYQTPYMYMPPVPQMMPPSINFNNATQSMMGSFVYANPYGGYDPNLKTNQIPNTNPNNFQIEDSDLEDEMMRREQYTKFCQNRPDIIDSKIVDESEKCAEFVNIAPKEPYVDMSFLKSTVPMRYSELSEDEEPEQGDNQTPKVIIKKGQQEQRDSSLASKKPAAKKLDPKKDKTLKSRMASVAKILEQERKIANQHAKRTDTLAKKTKKNFYSPTAASTNRKNVIRKQVQDAATNFMMNEKSIIKLKAEKEAIFSKMSRTHERLIDALQQLRNKLLEVYIPESTSDRNRRNRNGFEFSVRFLRNFLYPLKGMIDATRNTPKEHFNSLKTNDACNRVSHIYSLFLQAVLTYGKQLRHFMIDQVPQKLTTLLEMLFTTTNLCLDKRLFDRNDAIVESLLSQCANFLAFLEDLHAQRFVAAQESQRKVCMVHDNQSKFDLKMIINDLNMYEPRIVPKKVSTSRIDSRVPKSNKGSNSAKGGATPNSQVAQQQHQQQQQPARRVRRRVKQTKHATKRQQHEGMKSTVDSSSDVNEPKRIEDDVPTQVQDHHGQRSSEFERQDTHEIIENLQSMLRETPDLERYDKVDMINQSIMKALRFGHNQNFQQVLEPLLHTIDAIMKLPEDDNEIENDFKAFRMRISSLLNNQKKTQQGCDKGGHSPDDDSAAETDDYDTRSKHRGYRIVQLMDEKFIVNEDISDLDSEQHVRNGRQNQCDDDAADDNDNVNVNGINGKDMMDDEGNLYENDDDDVDGKFYISGEDCSAKRTTARSSRKGRLEPLVEVLNEREIAELYSSDADLYTPLRSRRQQQQQQQQPMQDSELMELLFSPTKSSPYDIPLSRRSRKVQRKSSAPDVNQTGAKKTVNKNNTPNQPTMNSASLRNKTTVPPSPAMMRLNKIAQAPLTARSKKVNILKKHIRRNPTGSPPPPPTVSPSTSMAHTPSLELRDDPQHRRHAPPSNANVSTSHKGCSANLTRNSPELDHHNVPPPQHLINGQKSNTSVFSNGKGEHQQNSKNASEERLTAQAKIPVANNSGERATIAATDEPSEKYNPANDTEITTNEMINEQSIPEDGCGDHKRTSALDAVEPAVSKTESKTKLQQKFFPYPDLNNGGIEGTKVHFDEGPLLKERDKFLSMCIRNPLYNNPNFASPWKILSRFSQQLTNEIVMQVESDLDCGVKSFVNDFLKLETRI